MCDVVVFFPENRRHDLNAIAATLLVPSAELFGIHPHHSRFFVSLLNVTSFHSKNFSETDISNDSLVCGAVAKI